MHHGHWRQPRPVDTDVGGGRGGVTCDNGWRKWRGRCEGKGGGGGGSEVGGVRVREVEGVRGWERGEGSEGEGVGARVRGEGVRVRGE